MSIKTYSELIKLPTYEERFEYLLLHGSVGVDTFGCNRYLNQMFYNSIPWRKFRRNIIIRDNGCDLASPGYEIQDKIVVIHHIQPLNVDDVLKNSSLLMDPDNVICVSQRTHRAIHYGDSSLLITAPKERTPNDTCPWKR